MHKNLEPLPSWGRRLAGIEGLRAVAAISVLAYHVGLMASDEVHLGPVGQVILPLLGQGLPLFFVLSGFLLFRPFATSILQGKGLPSVRRYAANRLLRIYPVYLVIFAVTSLAMGSVYLKGSTHGFGPENIGRLTEPLKFLANALLVQMFIPQFVMSGLPVAWSLTAELTFYVVVPLIAVLSALLVKWGANKAFALGLAPVAMVVVGLGVTSWGHAASSNLDRAASIDFAFGQTWTAVLLRSFLGQADLFAYGIAAALVVVFMHERGIERVSAWAKAALVVVAVLVMCAGMGGTMPYLSNLTGVASALILLAVVLPSSRNGGVNRLASILEWLPIRFTGTISYSIYLWHLPVIFWLMTHHLTVGGSGLALPFNTVLVLGLVLPLSALTYYLVERPAMLRKKPSPQVPVPVTRESLATSAVS